MKETHEYPLGQSAREGQRLIDQAASIETFTEDLFRRSCLGSGMSVLDCGSGVGDVALLAARFVGSQGSVLGVEKAPSSVEIARRRVADLGLANVAFAQGDLAHFTTDRTFDAVVGRFVLSYVPDRARVLRCLAQNLRPGGIVAFQEIDLSTMAQEPPSALCAQVLRWTHAAFAAGGAELGMGARLHATFLQAGLPPPRMVAATPVFGGPNYGGYEEIAQALRSLMPTIEREGIADPAEIDIDTLAERLREDAAANGRVLFMSRIVGAWTQMP